MSNIEPVNTKRLATRIVVALLFVLGAGALGLWVGQRSVPNDLPEFEGIAGGPKHVARPARVTEEDLSAPIPPLFFYAGANAPENWPVVLEELKLATNAGIDQVIVPYTLDWEGNSDLAEVHRILQRITEVNPKARVYLHLKLDPDKAWATARPTEVLKTAPDDPVSAAPYSALWRDEAARRAGSLAKDASIDKLGRHLRGFLLSALKDGRWEMPEGANAATCQTQAFRDWLRKRYPENETLRRAWGDDKAAVDTADVPAEPTDEKPGTIFLALPGQQRLADYREFLSDSTADSIAAVMAAIKTAVPANKVFAMYGHTFEVAEGRQGMLAMGRLLYSDLDGFAGPVSAGDRGIGAAGGLSGPAFSAALHQKQWILLDDTRTGVGRDAATGQIARLQGIRAEDVYNVQRRNFSLALVHGLGLAWSDPQGEGWLHEEEQWSEFERMREIYAELYPNTPIDPAAAEAKGSHAASSEAEPDPVRLLLAKSSAKKKEEPAKKPEKKKEDPDKKKQESTKKTPEPINTAATEVNTAPISAVPPALEPMPEPAPVGPPNNFKVGLAVVIDERAIDYLAAGPQLRDRLTLAARDAAMRSGAPVRTCLLQDVLDDLAPPAQVYLFVNAFYLSEAETERLHARLQRDQACAIWCYAPGYLPAEKGADTIAKAVGMKVQQVASPAQAGSTFTLGGRWLQEGAPIGEAAPVEPLFSIDDSEADVIAQYKASQKGSIALRVMPEGWTSIYVAEPSMNPALLRELLRVIEKRICFRLSDREFCDTAYVGLNVVAVHAKQVGEIPLSLGNIFDVQDLFDKSMGWQQKESITLSVKTGETRLLKLTPTL